MLASLSPFCSLSRNVQSSFLSLKSILSRDIFVIISSHVNDTARLLALDQHKLYFLPLILSYSRIELVNKCSITGTRFERKRWIDFDEKLMSIFHIRNFENWRIVRV